MSLSSHKQNVKTRKSIIVESNVAAFPLVCRRKLASFKDTGIVLSMTMIVCFYTKPTPNVLLHGQGIVSR